MPVTPIATKYNNYLFRSRLEARWAVFFDEMQIPYQYEIEGFEIAKEVRYLPDFYLPTQKAYVEVKGNEEQFHSDLPRICDIIRHPQSPVRRLIILGDIPYSKKSGGIYWFPVLYYSPLSDCVCAEWRTIVEYPQGHGRIAFDWGTNEDAICKGTFERSTGWKSLRLSPYPDEELHPRKKCKDGSPQYREWQYSEKLINAYAKARQARFEHGETPINLNI